MAPAGQLVGVLPHQEILRLCNMAAGAAAKTEGRDGVITPALSANVRSASYDLRLGSEFYVGESEGKLRKRSRPLQVQTLNEAAGALIIEPNTVVVVTAHEELDLGPDLIGRLSLKMDLLRGGLIMASQSQIDAGYSGRIFALLYNLSSEPRTIQHKQSFIRLELERLPEASNKPYIGDYENKRLAEILDTPIVSTLQEMRETVDGLESRITRTRWAGVATVLTILVAFAIFFFTVIKDLERDVGAAQPDSRANQTTTVTVRTCAEGGKGGAPPQVVLKSGVRC